MRGSIIRSKISPERYPPAFVLWFGPTGLTVARSLGRRGVPVIGLHHHAGEPAVRSRYAQVRLLSPVEDDPQAWLDLLLEEGRSLGGHMAVLFPAADAHWLFMARHREVLGKYFRFALPADGDLEIWPGKPFQYAAAARAGIPTPLTFFPRSREQLAALGVRMQYPCLVKPAFSHKWLSVYKNHKLSFVRTPEELVEVGQDAMDKGLEILIQEYVPGGDDSIYTFQAYANADGRVLRSSVRKKLRQYPPHFGSGCMAVSVREPRVEELGRGLMESLRFHGIGSVEFKWDGRDGQFKLMELNVRPGLMTALSLADGSDVIWAAYRDISGEPNKSTRSYRVGVRLVYLENDIKAFWYYRCRGQLTFLGWLRSLLGRTRDLYYAWDDPMPSVVLVLRALRRLGATLLRQLRAGLKRGQAAE